MNAQAQAQKPIRPLTWIYTKHFLLIAGVVFTFHLIFSAFGYNPTDDGFNLAYARRLLEGEIPHRDFISIRPVGSPLFHLLFLPFGGDYTYLLTRGIVTAQIVIFTWLWIQILKKKLSLDFSWNQESLLLIVATLCNLGCPVYAWYTTDGIFFCTLGVAFCTFYPRLKFWGYFLIGFAVLCKQNFVFFALGAPFLLGDRKKASAWIGAALPGILYLAFLAYFKALPDYFLQVTSHTSFLDIGTKPYMHRYFMIPLIAGAILSLLVRKFGKSLAPLLSGLVLINLLICSMGIFLGKVMPPALSSFGLSIGIIAASLFDREEKRALIRWGTAIVLLNWAGAISISGPFPFHSWGILVVFLFFAAEEEFSFSHHFLLKNGLVASTLIAALLIAHGRLHFLGREKPMSECTYSLDGLFPGCKGIQTNGNTHAFLVDMNKALQKVKGSRYAILPDCPGYWVKAKERNPLPMDWVQRLEIFHPKLIERMKHVLLAEKEKKTKFLIQKIQAHNLATAAFPEPLHLVDEELNFGLNEFAHYRFEDEPDKKYGGYYGLTQFVIDHFKKVDETQFFEIFE